MYSILLSKIESLKLLKEKCKYIINKDSKVTILPWAFPQELNSYKLMNEYFAKGCERYNKYINQLREIGINEENIIIGDCYSLSTEELTNIINSSEILILPGGNPEMMMNKILHKTELFYCIKHYKGIVIGESAGCLLQLERYFITKENNFYDYGAFYDGIGLLPNTFLIDVHSIDSKEYMNELNEISRKAKKKIYAIFDNGAILYNRKSNECELLGKVKEIITHS